MADLTPVLVTQQGVSFYTNSVVATSSMTVDNNRGDTFVVVSCTVGTATLDIQPQPVMTAHGKTIETPTIVAPMRSSIKPTIVGPLHSGLFNDSQNEVTIEFEFTTSVRVGAFRFRPYGHSKVRQVTPGWLVNQEIPDFGFAPTMGAVSATNYLSNVGGDIITFIYNQSTLQRLVTFPAFGTVKGLVVEDMDVWIDQYDTWICGPLNPMIFNSVNGIAQILVQSPSSILIGAVRIPRPKDNLR